jgi:hypothetical protein
MKAFTLAEVADIIDAVRIANLTAGQAIKAILEYRVNRPNKTVLRRIPNGTAVKSSYRGKENGYHTAERK